MAEIVVMLLRGEGCRSFIFTAVRASQRLAALALRSVLAELATGLPPLARAAESELPAHVARPGAVSQAMVHGRFCEIVQWPLLFTDGAEHALFARRARCSCAQRRGLFPSSLCRNPLAGEAPCPCTVFQDLGENLCGRVGSKSGGWMHVGAVPE